MILLGVGILALVFSVLCLIKGVNLGNQKAFGWIFIIVGVALLFTGFLCSASGFSVPYGGYEEPKLVSTSEVTFVSYDGQDVFVIDDGVNIICYEKVEVITADGKKYKMDPKVLFESTVEVIPEKDCKMPRIEEYLIKGKSSFPWSIAKENDKTQYKIYVPEGTVLETEN